MIQGHSEFFADTQKHALFAVIRDDWLMARPPAYKSPGSWHIIQAMGTLDGTYADTLMTFITGRVR